MTVAVKQQIELGHPDDDDLAFLYGTILTDGRDDSDGSGGDAPSANICVFAASQVDRSPTGSGVSARIAVQRRRGLIEIDQTRTFESVTGALFRGRAVSETTCGNHPAVVVEVSGEAHYSGEASFRAEAGDPLGGGFLLR